MRNTWLMRRDPQVIRRKAQVTQRNEEVLACDHEVAWRVPEIWCNRAIIIGRVSRVTRRIDRVFPGILKVATSERSIPF